MSEWKLDELLAGLHDEVQQRLGTSRKSFAHTGTKGEASESVWVRLLSDYLPRRYQVAKAHVVDSTGRFSEQIDVLVFDRQYSPFIFQFEGQLIVPAESVYAVFEAKQTISASLIDYAQAKVASVRKLHRTSLPIPHAGGTYPARPLPTILGGMLALDSDWRPPLGDALLRALEKGTAERQLDLGCVAAHGTFELGEDGYNLRSEAKAATAFLFELIARLQASATVPMIDIRAYSKWLR